MMASQSRSQPPEHAAPFVPQCTLTDANLLTPDLKEGCYLKLACKFMCLSVAPNTES